MVTSLKELIKQVMKENKKVDLAVIARIHTIQRRVVSNSLISLIVYGFEEKAKSYQANNAAEEFDTNNSDEDNYSLKQHKLKEPEKRSMERGKDKKQRSR